MKEKWLRNQGPKDWKEAKKKVQGAEKQQAEQALEDGNIHYREGVALL